MKSAYEEILAVLEKHNDVITGDYSTDIRDRLRHLIEMSGVLDDFGISVPASKLHGFWVDISSYQSLGLFGEEHGRTISWPDDGRQPVSEWLYLVSFPTGAYIYGGAYPTKTFGGMIDEIKAYGPKYIDSANKGFYFDRTNAAAIHKDLMGIIEKHRHGVEAEVKEQKKAELRRQLAKLEEPAQ